MLKVYRNVQIETADRLQIVILLYEGAIEFIKKAQDCIKNKDIPAKNLYVSKAQDIILALNDSLNMKAGGEIAQNLRRLYLFMNRYLLECSFQNNEKKLERLIKMLKRLKEAWVAIRKPKLSPSA